MRNATPQITIGVMQELIRRDTIKAALAGRSEKSLAILIKFIQRYINMRNCYNVNIVLTLKFYYSFFKRNISNPNYTPTLIDISNILLGNYLVILLRVLIQMVIKLNFFLHRFIHERYWKICSY